MYPPDCKNTCSKFLDVIIAHKVGNKKDFSNICLYFVGKYVDNLLITYTTSYPSLLNKQFNGRELMENGAGKFW